jgi:transcriptional regulator NrdR family protein
VANTTPTEKFTCPACGVAKSLVKDTRYNVWDNAVVRLRKCPCGAHYETKEKFHRVVARKIGHPGRIIPLHIGDEPN